MKVAIFDFDGTLYPEETFSLMMKHLKTHPIHNNKYRRFIRKILPVYIAYKLKLYPEQKMKEYSMRSYISAFGQTSETDIRDFFSKLGSEMSQKLSEPVLQRLHQHRNDGFYIMLVSGAFEPLLHSVTKAKMLVSIALLGHVSLLKIRKLIKKHRLFTFTANEKQLIFMPNLLIMRLIGKIVMLMAIVILT